MLITAWSIRKQSHEQNKQIIRNKITPIPQAINKADLVTLLYKPGITFNNASTPIITQIIIARRSIVIPIVNALRSEQ